MRKKYLVILMIAIVLSITGCSKSSTNIEKYLDTGTKIDTYAKYFMPDINDLPEHLDIEYKYYHKDMILFESDAIVLVIDYDKETYEKEKDKLKYNYTFLNEKIPFKYQKGKFLIPEYVFSINDYSFKVVEGNDKNGTEYPKSFGMIGISDEKKSIAYLYFYDYDLDYIGEKDEKRPMANFIKKYFKYDF